MIIDFSVTNFGPVKNEQTLSFEATADTTLEDYYIHEPIPGLRLLKFAMLYGPNASGKSTILEALDFLRDLILDPLDKKSDTLNFQPFLFDQNTPHESSKLKISFVKNNIKYQYIVEFNQSFILKEEMYYYPRGRQAEFFTRTTNTENNYSSISFGGTVKVPKRNLNILIGNTIGNNTLLGAYLKSNVDIPELHTIFEWFAENLMALINPNQNLFSWTSNKIDEDDGFRKKVIEIINKADVQINDIEIDEKVEELQESDISKLAGIVDIDNLEKLKKDKKIVLKNILFHHNVINNDNSETYKLPKQFESLGTKRFYELSGVLVTLLEGNKVSYIDEIESSLHSDLMKHFILMHLANSNSSQLLITTHNLSLLDEKEILRNDAIWFTQKLKDGSTDLYSLDDFDSSTFRKGASIINSYKIGKLGATPNLGNIFLNE